jgi:phage terminase Nu1 subunit (DNA packaging protein)
MPDLLGQKDLASLFQVESRTIRLWVQAGCPERRINGRPMYSLTDVIAWRREEDQRTAGATPDEARERVLKLRAERELVELKLDERRKVLVPSADVDRQWSRIAGVLRSRLLASRGRWAPRIIGLAGMKDAARIMDEMIADVLESLRDSADDVEDEAA